jgi:hypothetical protein
MNEWMNERALLNRWSWFEIFSWIFFNKWKIIHAKQKLMVFEKWYKKKNLINNQWIWDI